MEQRIGVAMPVMQSPQTPPQKMGMQKLFSFVFGGELVDVKRRLHSNRDRRWNLNF